MVIDTSSFDFVDCGASTGGSTEFALKKLGGQKGLGVNIDPKRVQFMLDKGYDCIEGDITSLPFADNSVRFTVLSHILEHLPNQEVILSAIKEAVRVSQDFIFIQGPYYEADQWLEKRNLKFFWSDLRGHLYPFKFKDILEAVNQLGLAEPKLYVRAPVDDVSDKTLHSLASPFNSLYFDPEIHPAKPKVKIDIPLYKEIVCFIPTRRSAQVPDMESVFNDLAPWNFTAKKWGVIPWQRRLDRYYY